MMLELFSALVTYHVVPRANPTTRVSLFLFLDRKQNILIPPPGINYLEYVILSECGFSVIDTYLKVVVIHSIKLFFQPTSQTSFS